MSPSRAAKRERTGFETAVLTVSILAVTLVVVGLIVSRLSGGDGPPDLQATIRATGETRSGGEVFVVTIHNAGGETAENVVVEATLGEETREVDVLSVAKGDEEEVTVIFPRGSAGTAEVRVLSYHTTTRG